MNNVLWLDLETRSRCNLPVKGVYNYADDKSTEILIACYALGNGPVKTWRRFRAEPMPPLLANALRDKRCEIRAHSAAFERLILKKLPIERFYCTATQARAAALPGSLEDVGRALTARLQKDVRGYELIRLLSIPQPDGTFNNDPKLLEDFAAYCKRDVEAMRSVSQMLPELTDEARHSYCVNERINDRGIPIDTELCELALKYGDAERAEANDRAIQLTEGKITKARGTLLTAWVYERLPEEAAKLMVVHRRRKVADTGGGDTTKHASGTNRHNNTGEDYVTLTLDADTRGALLNMAEEQTGLIDDDVIEVIGTAEAASAASVAKFSRMLNMTSSDGRLRGAFVLNGASGTGRYSSRGAQLHNFPRLCAKDPEAIKKLMKKGATLPGPVLQVLKSMLRPAICPGAGRVMVRCDWSAVEARGLPWLAGADTYLDAFRDPQRDVYMEQALAVGLSGNRPAGKVAVLALGYGGADGALTVMCKTYGVDIENKPSVVRRWRAANPWAGSLWRALDSAAKRAVANPGTVFRAGKHLSFLADKLALKCELPSGRRLYYPLPKFDDEVSYIKAAWKPKKDAKEWPRARLWGGLLAENVTQAVCADLLRNALGADLPIVGHVHDEILLESSLRESKKLAKMLKAAMLTVPHWATRFPLAAEIDITPRFRK